MTEVIQHPARQVSVNTEETFSQYARRIRDTRSEIRTFKNGAPIVLRSELQYTFLMLGMERLLTPEEFELVFMAIMTKIKEMEAAGILPPDVVKTVETPFDLTPPEIPERFLSELAPGVLLESRFVGSMGFEIVTVYPPDPEEVEEPTVELTKG